MEQSKTLVLFDVDGTLTKARASIMPEMEQLLIDLKKKVDIGLVGGSDLAKIAEQMTSVENGIPCGNQNSEEQIEKLIKKYDYVFAENGLTSYHKGQLLAKQNILDKLDEERIQRFINFVLEYFSRLKLPVKRGNFIEFRNGMINISPIGRSCSREERNQFFEYDKQHKIREKLVEDLHAEFDKTDLDLDYVIGGQISVDCFPKGWDKRFCLQFVEKKYDTIHFFGDRIAPGGNDHTIYEDPRTIGHGVESPEQTQKLLKDLFFSQ